MTFGLRGGNSFEPWEIPTTLPLTQGVKCFARQGKNHGDIGEWVGGLVLDVRMWHGWFVGWFVHSSARAELPSEHADVKVEIRKGSHAGAQSKMDEPLINFL